MAEPKCPECNAQGIEKVVAKKSQQESKGGDAWFEVVHCEACGHIYGFFAKHVLSHEMRLTPALPNFG